MPTQDRLPHVNLLDVRVDALRSSDLTAAVARLVQNKAHALVLNVNIHCLNLAHENPWLRDLLNSAEIVFADGEGVVLASRLLGRPLPGRITPADWIWELCETSQREGHRLYFLGATENVAAEAAQRLLRSFPGLEIVGTHDGYFDKHRWSDANRDVVAEINHLRPDILLVGFGMPMQEQWLKENWEDLRCRVALTVGGLFDLLSGRLRRPPLWMRRIGLEWVGRLMIEPRRLWRRYVIGNPVFAGRVLRQWWASRRSGGPAGR